MARDANGSKKWNRSYIETRFGETPETIYPFFIADMDFSLPETIHKQVMKELEGDFGYFDLGASYFESIANWYKETKQVTIKNDWILPSVGTVSSIHFISKAVNNPIFGTLTPIYGAFDKMTDYYGDLHSIPLLETNKGYEIPFDLLEKELVDKKINVLLFCNPHNPSGKIWSKEELTKVVQICQEHGVLLVSDEIHSDLCHQGDQFYSLAHFFSEYSEILICSSPNKAFNLSGLNSSYVISSNLKLLQQVKVEQDKLHVSVNRIGAKYTEVVYREGTEWLEELKRYLEDNVTLLNKLLNIEGFEIERPSSGYLVWIKLPKIEDIDQFVLDVALNTGVLLESGSRFIDNYDGFIRINVATSRELLKEGLEKLTRYYKTIK